MLTVAEILAAIEQLPERDRQELSQVVLNLPINSQIEQDLNAQTASFWERVEQFRALLQSAEIDVNEIWDNVRDRSPGREVDLW
jgi:FixJ family two-component response regulator